MTTLPRVAIAEMSEKRILRSDGGLGRWMSCREPELECWMDDGDAEREIE